MPAVSDSSPRILYAANGRLDLLAGVFAEVYVPPAVWREIVTAGAGRAGAADVAQMTWIRQVPLPGRPAMPTLPFRLGAGETEAIALAASMTPAVPVLLDDRRARRAAESVGLVAIGCGGVLLLAKTAGLVPSIRPLLADLRAAGLYLNAAATHEILALAGEQ